MRYAEFRERLEDALREENLLVGGGDRRIEVIDVGDGVRHWEAYVHRAAMARTEPFSVSAALEFEWTPIEAARSFTCEEDLLTELVGRRTRLPRTERRWIRVDLSLRARLPYGSTTPMPEPALFGGWTAAAVKDADAAFTHLEEKSGRVVAILGGHGDLEIQATCTPEGLGFLSGISIAGFRMVRVPRVWDTPERRAAEADSHRDLRRLAGTFRRALDGWTESISTLATWIRYAPPSPGAKPVEPWLDDEYEDDDGGPGTTH
jgi:hypothetical protein